MIAPSAPRRLIQNAVYLPTEGVWLKSSHVHDFNCYHTADGGQVCVDGGLEYTKRSFTRAGLYEDWSLYSDDTFDHKAERTLWGTYGKGGKGPRRWVPLAQCEVDHLEAILTTQLHIRGQPVEQIVFHWWAVKRGLSPKDAARRLTILRAKQAKRKSLEHSL